MWVINANKLHVDVQESRSVFENLKKLDLKYDRSGSQESQSAISVFAF